MHNVCAGFWRTSVMLRAEHTCVQLIVKITRYVDTCHVTYAQGDSKVLCERVSVTACGVRVVNLRLVFVDA